MVTTRRWLSYSPQSYGIDSTVYLGTWDGLFRSTDGGDSWRELGSGLTDTWIIEVVVSPSFANDSTLIVAARNKDWNAGDSLFISTDRGDTWSKVTANLGVTWGFWATTRLVVSLAFASDGTLYAATLDGLMRSTDRGINWQKVYSYDHVSQANFAPWVALSPNFSDDNTLFTSKVCEGVYRSTDRGDSWQKADWSITDSELASFGTYYSCDPPGVTSLVFSPSYAQDHIVFLWTEVGIFQLTILI